MMTPPLPGAQPPLGKIPADIGCAADYEVLAQRFMAPPSYDYVAGGSGRDLTVAANLAAFARWDIYPRLLRDVGAGHTRVSVAGQQFAHPVFLAPVAHQVAQLADWQVRYLVHSYQYLFWKNR